MAEFLSVHCGKKNAPAHTKMLVDDWQLLYIRFPICFQFLQAVTLCAWRKLDFRFTENQNQNYRCEKQRDIEVLQSKNTNLTYDFYSIKAVLTHINHTIAYLSLWNGPHRLDNPSVFGANENLYMGSKINGNYGNVIDHYTNEPFIIPLSVGTAVLYFHSLSSSSCDLQWWEVSLKSSWFVVMAAPLWLHDGFPVR